MLKKIQLYQPADSVRAGSRVQRGQGRRQHRWLNLRFQIPGEYRQQSRKERTMSAATATSTAPSKPAVVASRQPNLYQLSGDGIEVTYSTSGFDGKPHLSYQDAMQSKQFAGDQIRTVKTEIGTLVTVTIFLTVDSGSTSFTLLLP